MKNASHSRLFGPIMFWTGVTTIFAWLPLVRILARPEGYRWQVLALSGDGTEGPFWIFLPGLLYVLVLLFTGFRGPRTLFHPMLVLWHLAVTVLLVAGAVGEGFGGRWEGQGLHFTIPLWLLVLPSAAMLALSIVWVIRDRRQDELDRASSWGRGNTIRLAASIALLAVALLLFGAGTNYNWLTAAAIVATIAHWILLMDSFAHGSNSRTGPERDKEVATS